MARMKTVKVAEIAADLDQDMSDEWLMKKYEVSRDGLERMLADVLTALANGFPEIDVESTE